MCTAYEKQKRIREVVKRLCEGQPHEAICQFMSESWQVTERHGRRYISEATEVLRQSGQADIATEKGKAVQRLERIFAESESPRIAIEAQKEINKLFGLYAPEKQELSGKDGGAIRHTIEYVNDWRETGSVDANQLE